MSLGSFLSALLADGRVQVAGDDRLPDEDFHRADELLAAFEREYRDDLPGTPPPISPPAARYGAVMLYRICQYLVFRDVATETIHHELGRALDEPLSPPVHYSVDLTFRFLPDAVKLCRGIAEGDPLVEEITRLGNRWPLSSVGMEECGEGPVDTFVDDPCLLRLYVDRIIARKDLGRLADPCVRAEAVRVLGGFPELAPEIADAVGATGGTVGQKEVTQ